MGLEFTFHEYIDAWGRSFVGAWLRDDVPPMVRQKFNEQFGYLEGTPRTQWSMPYVRPVGDGLLEARVQWDKRLYRILLTHTPGRKPTLLHGFVKRGNLMLKRINLASVERLAIEHRRAAFLTQRFKLALGFGAPI